MGKIGLKDIETLPYEGYLWWSDQKEPVVYDNAPVKLPEEQDNPFVVEGLLFHRGKGLSYSIKYVDGRYIVQEYVVAPEDWKQQEPKTYAANRMGGRKLCFLRYWEERLDAEGVQDAEHPEGYPVLVQTKNVFVGFAK